MNLKILRWMLPLLLFGSNGFAKVQKLKRNFSLGVAAEQPNFEFALSPTGRSSDREVKYQPNLAATNGFTAGLYGLQVRYMTQNEFSEKDRAQKGHTKYDDIRLGSALGGDQRFRIQGYYTRYKGLFVENSGQVDPAYQSRSDKIQRSDMEVRAYGLEFYWIVSPKEFSQAAAFSQTALQKESGGSWVFKFDFDSAKFSADSVLIPEDISDDFGEDAGLVDGSFETLSGLVGYGYSLVWNDFYLTPMGLFGYGLQNRDFNLGDENKKGTSTVQKYYFGLATGYNVEDLFLGLKFDVNSLVYKVGSVRIAQNLSAFALSLGFRF